MFVRQITPETLGESSRISSIAFEYPYAPETDWAKEARQMDEEPDSRGERDWRQRWCAFDDETGKMMASVHLTRYDLRYNGRIVHMSGVGGVISLPEFRRRGAIRACMAEAMKASYERGDMLSQLYPFSDAFYRKFGFENFHRICIWDIPLASIPDMKPSGRIEPFRKGDDWRPYNEVWNRMGAPYQLSSVRNELDWRSFLKNEPEVTKRYTYLYRAADGTPKGYIVYTHDGRVMNCVPSFGPSVAFAFADREGFEGLLAFVKSFSAYSDTLRVALPESFPAEAMLSLHNPVKTERRLTAEGRIVNAKLALEVSPCRGSGRFVIGLKDPFCPWNEGNWETVYVNGVCVKCGRTDAAPDVVLTVQDFTRLLMGGASAADIPLLPNAELLTDAPLENIFFKKNMWMVEMF